MSKSNDGMSNNSESNKDKRPFSLSGSLQSVRRAVSGRGRNSEKNTQALADSSPSSNPFLDPPPAYTAEGFSQGASEPPPERASSRGRTPSIYSRLRGPSSNNASSETDQFRFLAEFDTLFLIDDSSSMSWDDAGNTQPQRGQLSRWQQTSKVIEQIVPVCMRYDDDGVDIYFLNDPYHFSFEDRHRGEDCWSRTGNSAEGKATHAYIGVGNADHVRNIFNARSPALSTPTGKRLGDIMRTYVNCYEMRQNEGKGPPKPLNIIVITDGAANDQQELREVVVREAERLDSLSAPYHQLGVQFFQVGKDQGAAKCLHQLDDDLVSYRAGKELRDIVDCITYEQLSIEGSGSELTADVILKVVLGSVNKHLDNQRIREGLLTNPGRH